MPHALTDRQSEYLEFIREYIKQNECAPRLEEIAEYLNVTKPTANVALNILQDKGYLTFDRDKISGFYIRTPERYTPDGTLWEIRVIGFLDRYGEIHEFPNYHGHFPCMLPDNTGEMFALEAHQHIPSAGILSGDKMIFTNGGKAKPGDISIFPLGKRLFLVRMYAMDFSDEMPFYELAKKWQETQNKYENHLFWWPLAEKEETSEYLARVAVEQKLVWQPISPDMIVGKAVRLVRRMAI